MTTETRICSETGTVITRQMVINCISDTFKSVNGMRPRHDYSKWTFEELGDYLTDLQEEEKYAYEQEMKWQQQHDEQRDAKVLELMGMGASDRETAERWLAEAE
jgi:hypothetical protein